MKILLINPPRNRAQTQNYGYTFSFAIACLSAMLKQNGYNPKILDLFDCLDWDSISQMLRTEQPDLVGITCLTNTRQSVFRLASIVKAINERATVVVGGSHPTVLYEQILNSYAVDAVAIGEGDLTFVNLVRAVENGDPFDGVKGIGCGATCGDRQSRNRTPPTFSDTHGPNPATLARTGALLAPIRAM